ncbi:MAG TPA: transglutaminase family protein [Kofleriaceae bacterium]
MQIRVGYELVYDCPKATPMILVLNIHYTRMSDVIRPDHMITTPAIPISSYRDSYGNWCTRIVAPPGRLRLTADALINDSGQPDIVAPWLPQHPIPELPEETLLFLLGSRYCETEPLLEFAWQRFEPSMPGWPRVQAICDFVHAHIEFGYEHANPTTTAWQVYQTRRGVCRDYAHLAIALCRCTHAAQAAPRPHRPSPTLRLTLVARPPCRALAGCHGPSSCAGCSPRAFSSGACGGRRTVVAFVADATLTRSLLTSLGRPAEPATFAPARVPPQAKLARYDPA